MRPSLRPNAAAAACSAFLAFLAIMATAGISRGEVIELLDKTKMTAKIIHYFDGVYTVEANGQTMKLPKEKIRSVSFQLPPARPEFSTPEKTFERWRKALNEGAMDRVIDCYALMYQGMLANQMGIGQASDKGGDGMKKMQKEIEGTKFEIKGSSIKGDTATLKVQRKKGDDSDTGDIAFVKENGEWKMLPPQ
ncbi:MAG TPA: DUF4878 domain-containing protein [Polyangia bacterium]|jgi:hypothetical protein|nr:DUF4878 domain-containing protein [Polyangia bacterium]